MNIKNVFFWTRFFLHLKLQLPDEYELLIKINGEAGFCREIKIILLL